LTGRFFDMETSDQGFDFEREPMTRQLPPLSEADRLQATVFAVSVRNALEGTLHGGEVGSVSLTDEQMRLF